jgi:hypothetical protein
MKNIILHTQTSFQNNSRSSVLLLLTLPHCITLCCDSYAVWASAATSLSPTINPSINSARQTSFHASKQQPRPIAARQPHFSTCRFPCPSAACASGAVACLCL